MRNPTFKLLALLLGCLISAFAFGGTLTVTSPTTGSFVGPNNSLTFNISGAVVQVTVNVAVTYPTGATTTFNQQFSPDNNGDISGTMSLNFAASNPQGQYKIVVSATEPNNTYTPTTLEVTLLPTAPKFNSFSPPDGTFVKGVVNIRASINDSYLQQWRVQVNGQDIPNNTGTSNTVSVNWDTSGIVADGQQTITITATDKANDTSTETMTVTLDRVPPIVTFVYPASNTILVPGSTIDVIINVQGEFSGSVSRTGIDVLAETTAGVYIERVAFVSFESSTGTNSTWIGRIRYQPGLLPKNFQIVATCVDNAGNVATPQTIGIVTAH